MPTAASILRGKTDLTAPITASPDSSVLEAARLMNEHRIGALCVVDEGGTLKGMFTERDILTRVVAEGRDPESTRVKDVMTHPVIACPPETSSDELRTIMRQCRIRHIPILENDTLLGVVSIGDLNMAQVQVMTETISYLERYMYQP
ncbi:MAG: CBS domain-containing protein [Phycisphaerales bacterium JB043]